MGLCSFVVLLQGFTSGTSVQLAQELLKKSVLDHRKRASAGVDSHVDGSHCDWRRHSKP